MCYIYVYTRYPVNGKLFLFAQSPVVLRSAAQVPGFWSCPGSAVCCRLLFSVRFSAFFRVRLHTCIVLRVRIRTFTSVVWSCSCPGPVTSAHDCCCQLVSCHVTCCSCVCPDCILLSSVPVPVTKRSVVLSLSWSQLTVLFLVRCAWSAVAVPAPAVSAVSCSRSRTFTSVYVSVRLQLLSLPLQYVYVPGPWSLSWSQSLSCCLVPALVLVTVLSSGPVPVPVPVPVPGPGPGPVTKQYVRIALHTFYKTYTI